MPQIIPEPLVSTSDVDSYTWKRWFHRIWKLGQGLTRTKYVRTTTYYLSEDDYCLLCDNNAAGANINVYLPEAKKFENKQFVVKLVRQSGVRTVIVNAVGTDTIDGSATYTISTLNNRVTLIAGPTNTGVQWFVIGT